MKPAEAIASLVGIIRRKHLSTSTEHCYSHWLRRYMGFLAEAKPAGDSTRKIETFLTRLAQTGVAAATQDQERAASGSGIVQDSAVPAEVGTALFPEQVEMAQVTA